MPWYQLVGVLVLLGAALWAALRAEPDAGAVALVDRIRALSPTEPDEAQRTGADCARHLHAFRWWGGFVLWAVGACTVACVYVDAYPRIAWVVRVVVAAVMLAGFWFLRPVGA